MCFKMMVAEFTEMARAGVKLPDEPVTCAELVRMTVRATVAPGREWLAESLFPDLLRERAHEGLIVHGPVTLAVDERALKSFARASATTRWNARRAELARIADAA